MAPGAIEIVNRLHAENMPLAVATSSTSEALKAKTQKYQEVYRKFSVILPADHPNMMGRRSKPAPDLLEEAAKMLNADPKSCMYVGDNLSDMQAAKAASMTGVAIPDPNRICQEFVEAGAQLVCASLQDFAREIGLEPAFI